MNSEPLVSIIIPSLNSEKTITRCLESIQTQTYKNIETILVDKGSKDATADIARSMGAMVYVITADERCPQMNFGAKKANGMFVYIVGSDFVLEPGLVAEAVEVSLRDGCDAVVVHNDSDPTISFWSKVRNLERNCYYDDDLNISARFIRRDVFLGLGGYDEKLVACEDYEIHNRLVKNGNKIGRITAREVHIGEPRTLGEIARKHYYYGGTMGEFMERGGERRFLQLMPIRPAYIRHWKDFVTQPVLTIGFVVYQITRYGTAIMGVARKKITGH
ncbi:MAG: Glycosyltransferase AglE [Methanomassiliicoccales archaeon PtaU1.Bin124]|nr:MAG: Glycosyltransferase AglE [Methanomassiliicoccales archaeon PtaU1.Bin124]